MYILKCPATYKNLSIVLFDFLRILRFSFSSLVNVFLLSVFFFFNVFCTSFYNQENHDSKYESIREYCQLGKKTLVLVCASWSYTLKLFGPYPKQLGISKYMCNFLKAFLLCKLWQIFMFCCRFSFVFIFFNKISFLRSMYMWT